MLLFPETDTSNTGGKRGHEDMVANSSLQVQSEETGHTEVDQWVKGEGCGKPKVGGLGKAQRPQLQRKEKLGAFIISRELRI